MDYHSDSYTDCRPRRGRISPTSAFPSEREFIADYCRFAGRGAIENWNFYVVYNLFRSAAIIQGVYKRGLDGNASSDTAIGFKDACRMRSDRAWDLVEALYTGRASAGLSTRSFRPARRCTPVADPSGSSSWKNAHVAQFYERVHARMQRRTPFSFAVPRRSGSGRRGVRVRRERSRRPLTCVIRAAIGAASLGRGEPSRRDCAHTRWPRRSAPDRAPA